MKSRYSYSKSWYEDIIHHPSQYYVEPFKICGNLYFVGTKDSASHLLDTGDGLVLFDTGYPNMTGNLIQSIWKCGFKPESIRHIFHTHGHFDHFGATRLLMTLSEKTVTYMGAKDAEMLENKPELSLCHYLEGIKTEFFKPDIWLSDGETISIGNTYIKAISTPGHSMGAMTYQFGVRDDDKEYCAVLCGGTGFNTLNIDFIEKYHIDWRKDFEKSISIWKSMKTDIFLGNHTPQSKTLEKRKNLTEGVNNPFINSEDFYRYICNVEHNYHDMILQDKNMDSDDLIYTSKRWLQRYAYDEPVEVISLYYRATYLDGVIVINVDKSEYGKLLRNVLISDNQTVFLFNSKGDIICTTDNDFQNIGQDQRFMDTIRNHIVSGQYQELSNKWTRIYGKLYYLTIQYSEYADLYQVSAISIKQMFYELNYYLLMALTILILDIAVMFILAYTYTKRSFSYIEECINIFSAAERGEKIDNKFIKEQDEYGILMNNIIFLYIENNKMQMDLREREHENEITEMAALQLQINPHFIFNTLQIMDLEIIKVLGNQSGLHKIVQQLSLVVKYALTNPTEEVKLKKEIDYLKTYLEIQNMRFEGGGIIYFEVDETILETKVFRLILQPMLENCFEHGMRIEKQHLLIKVKIFDQGDYIHFAVVDNGRGMSREEISELYMKINNKESKNIGLTNLNRRLLLHYGKESALKIQSKEGQGTIISFKVPKQNSNK